MLWPRLRKFVENCLRKFVHEQKAFADSINRRFLLPTFASRMSLEVNELNRHFADEVIANFTSTDPRLSRCKNFENYAC